MHFSTFLVALKRFLTKDLSADDRSILEDQGPFLSKLQSKERAVASCDAKRMLRFEHLQKRCGQQGLG